MDAILAEFLIESRENLDRVERGLVELEQDPTSSETLASVFRAIHSIKGATGFLGLSKLGAVAHAGESLLSRLRDRSVVFTPAVTNVLLALVDAIRQMLASIETTRVEGDADYASLIDDLGRPDRATPPAALPDEGPAVDTPAAAATAIEPDPAAELPEASYTAPYVGNIRVNVDQLDRLMNLVTELVLIRNELQQRTSGEQDAGLLSCSRRLTAITTELQEAVMKTRMQPIDSVWNRFPRLVRDSALQCGKTVHLEMEGKDTELDKTLIEAIRDPLTHLLRNGIDHGLEGPEERRRAGKPAEGRLLLRAFHEGGQVHIEVSDDGAGVDLVAVKRTALAHDLITADQARDISDRDALDLIFLPGFSTAREITSISGRGVGMDVVRTNIARIGGTVTISSQPGRGTTLTIRMPLTLAIMPALVVRASGERYAIPQSSVLELVRLGGSASRTEIQMFQEAAVYRLRGESVPLVALDVVLGTSDPAIDAAADITERAATIVVLHVDGRKFGVIVDDVDDTQEIVIKPLGDSLKPLSMFAGATIMGDGRAILILDVPGFAAHACVLAEGRPQRAAAPDLPAAGARDDKHSLLLFAGDDEARMAVPVAGVLRLEVFASDAVERSEGRDVVQYRGDIMTLVRLTQVLPERRREPRHPPAASVSDDRVHVIVYANGDRQIGLVVNRILDTIEYMPSDLRPPTRRGTIGSVVVQGRITEILDVEQICAGLTTGSRAIALPEAVRA